MVANSTLCERNDCPVFARMDDDSLKAKMPEICRMVMDLMMGDVDLVRKLDLTFDDCPVAVVTSVNIAAEGERLGEL
ncbi:MAG TPA: hypothetical protein VJC09_01065 [Candidatus Saccharimonadales bacterium]|nr:hypothetical protein [Candidatus Saccharimonadales bacterium]